MKWIFATGVMAVITIIALSLATQGGEAPSGLVTELRLTRGRASFELGQPIVMKFTVTNQTPESIHVPYKTPAFNLWISQCSGDVCGEVWSSSYRANSSNPDGTPNEEWKPGETLVSTITWMQEDNQGQPIVPGLFRASGGHNACRRVSEYPCEAAAYVWFEIER